MSATSETTRDYSVHNRVRGIPLTEVNVALGVGIVGVFAALAGVGAFLIRIRLAALFFGAHVWFETPVTEADAMKVLIMTIHTLALLAWGVFIAGVAFVFALIKWMQSQTRTQPS